jgi:hypothetical protein
MKENRISLSFSEADKTTINETIQKLNTLLAPKLITLSKDDRKRLYKINDDAIPFVEKVAQYAVSNPEFVPNFMDANEFTKDFSAFTDLRAFARILMQLSQSMDDTSTLAGSEADEFARMFYASVAQAAKLGAPGAQAIYEDLRPRFEAQRVKTTKNPPTP